jgi:hypothetical protein
MDKTKEGRLAIVILGQLQGPGKFKLSHALEVA